MKLGEELAKCSVSIIFRLYNAWTKQMISMAEDISEKKPICSDQIKTLPKHLHAS